MVSLVVVLESPGRRRTLARLVWVPSMDAVPDGSYTPEGLSVALRRVLVWDRSRLVAAVSIRALLDRLAVLDPGSVLVVRRARVAGRAIRSLS